LHFRAPLQSVCCRRATSNSVLKARSGLRGASSFSSFWRARVGPKKLCSRRNLCSFGVSWFQHSHNRGRTESHLSLEPHSPLCILAGLEPKGGLARLPAWVSSLERTLRWLLEEPSQRARLLMVFVRHSVYGGFVSLMYMWQWNCVCPPPGQRVFAYQARGGETLLFFSWQQGGKTGSMREEKGRENLSPSPPLSAPPKLLPPPPARLFPVTRPRCAVSFSLSPSLSSRLPTQV